MRIMESKIFKNIQTGGRAPSAPALDPTLRTMIVAY